MALPDIPKRKTKQNVKVSQRPYNPQTENL
jgi:hypothetical protein